MVSFESIQILLASKSPRRKQLLEDAGFHFKTIRSVDIDETVPSEITSEAAAEYLSELKAEANKHFVKEHSVLLTADTVVCLDGALLGKPVDFDDAFRMLNSLSGKMHTVITGVTLLSTNLKKTFSSVTNVWFKAMNNEEIRYYIQTYKPYDKAGAYGIQEWIGLTCIEKIEGSYFNVMGLPIEKVYDELKAFIPKIGSNLL